MEANLFTIEFAKLFPELNMAIGAGILIFVRIIGVMQFAPPFNRSEIPAMPRLSLALILTVIISMILKPAPVPNGTSLLLCIVLNFTFGFVIGYIINCIIAAISSAGDIINSQIGVSSATILDPSSGTQTSLMGNFFTILATIIFMMIGGFYWTINALIKSFEVFPVYSAAFPINEVINLDYLVKITVNTFVVGMQIAAPILLATLGQDIILGTISKTAPQVNVFQMSFLFKPVMGALILTWVMPMLVNVTAEYLASFSSVF
ncbi:MAG: flagellar biosynthetic protein FliR [Candidatus Gastranaerophilales bacterium]|nr:flagellar biosynthetic protein FliR [Candidatus Gastranaerophilales bacterium]